MEQVTFTCLTPGSECEWFHLKDFVDEFNAIHGTSYYRLECTDVYGPDNKQPARAPKRPEVLLESVSDGEDQIVIERKAVVWPSDFQRNHSKEHFLPDRVINFLGGEFNDSTYQLAFHADDLRGKNKRQVKEFGSQIGIMILSNIARAKSQRGVSGRSPIRWRFRPLEPYEIDEPIRRGGIRITIDVPSIWDLEPLNASQYREAALAGFAERFHREANKAGEKYGEYNDCEKLLVVQFFGENELIMDEDIVEVIKAARIPAQIDQVWLTGREWISLDDYKLAWERVR